MVWYYGILVSSTLIHEIKAVHEQIFNFFRTGDEKSIIKLRFNRNYQCYSKRKTKEYAFTRSIHIDNTVKPLNSGHLRVLKNLSVVERCPLLEGNLIKIATFGTKYFVCYSWHAGYLVCPLLGIFTVYYN